VVAALEVREARRVRFLFPFKPAGDAARCLPHLRFGSRITEADIVPAAIRIEIDARRDRDADVLEHGLGEGFAVASEAADIGIEIEGSIGWQDG